MTRILEVLPPPDLSDRPILTADTSYLRTRLSDDTPDTPNNHPEFYGGPVGFINVLKRFLLENDGVCTCSMCEYVWYPDLLDIDTHVLASQLRN